MARKMEYRTRQQHHWTEHHGDRQAFHNSYSSLGAIHRRHYPRSLASHLMPLLTVALPFLIAEFIKDSDKRSRALKVSRIGGAVAREAIYAVENSARNHQQEVIEKGLKTFGERAL